MKVPRVSVIIPLYNKGPYILRALRSVSAQTFTDFELIVVDDGSTDSGPELLSAHLEAGLRLIRQSNYGPGAARNRGAAEAQGEFLAFLDADDEWTYGFLGRAIAILDRVGLGVATFTCTYIEFPGPISAERLWHNRGIRSGVYHVQAGMPPLFFAHLIAFMITSGTVCRASSFRKWGGFAERHSAYGEDANLWVKMLLNEGVYFSLWPGVILHSEASALRNWSLSTRPLEPILENPAAIRAACPKPLLNLLTQVLAIRAFKTACQWAYWGRWHDARDLWRRFRTRGAYGTLYLLCATLYSDTLPALWRTVQGRRKIKPSRFHSEQAV